MQRVPRTTGTFMVRRDSERGAAAVRGSESLLACDTYTAMTMPTLSSVGLHESPEALCGKLVVFAFLSGVTQTDRVVEKPPPWIIVSDAL
jgi:hypothetical protein